MCFLLYLSYFVEALLRNTSRNQFFVLCLYSSGELFYTKIVEHKYSEIGLMQVSKQYGEQAPPTLLVRG